MGELFANFKGYDVQETRKEARAAGIIQAIKRLKEPLRWRHGSLLKCGMNAENTRKEIEKYWQCHNHKINY